MKYKILIVDDEQDVKSLFEQKFRKEIKADQYELLFAYDGTEAVEIVENEEVDIVCSDINMPKMNGLALLEELSKANPHIKTIMITAYGDMENIRSAMNKGAFDFITKPINFKDLKLTIEKTCSTVSQIKKDEAFRNDIIGARNILDNILPKDNFDNSIAEVGGLSNPAKIVGGDFFNFFPLKNGDLSMVIADVCGKGFTAALFMYLVYNLHRLIVEEYTSPSKLLEALNKYVYDFSLKNQFVTISCALLQDKRVTIASAGHCPVFKYSKKDNEITAVMASGAPVGVFRDEVYSDMPIDLEDGDLIVFYTDGVLDAMNDRGERFGEDRLKEIIATNADSSVRKISSIIFEQVNVFTAHQDQNDDVTLMLVKAK